MGQNLLERSEYMKKIKLNFNKRLAFLLSTLLFVNLVFSDALLFANAADGTNVQGDYNGDGKLEIGDLVGWVNADKSSSDDANSLRTELLRIVDTSVENDDGTFEGNDGKISLYNSRLLEGSYAYGGAAFMNFEEIKTDQGSKISVVSNSSNGNAFDMLYIKFDKEIKQGVTYKVSMDLEALNSDYTNGTWKYCFTDESKSLGTLVANTTISEANATKAQAFFKEDTTIEFVAKKDCSHFYMVLWEYSTSGVMMDFTIDNIQLEGSFSATTVVENDDGTFEGNTGKISLYNSRLLEGSHAYNGAAFMDFQKVITMDETKLRVTSTSSTGNAFDMLYIKFNEPVKAGVTYTVSMDLESLDPNYTKGTWKYSFTDENKKLGTLLTNTTIAEGNAEKAKEFFKDGTTLSFTATKDCGHFYMVLWEYSNTGVMMDFTIDNIQLTKTYPLASSISNDDGTFEGDNGIISLCYPATSGTTNADAKFCTDVVSFQKIDTGANTLLSIKSQDYTGHTTRKGAVYIKFAQTFKANTTYTISYDAKWNGADLESNSVAFGYSILPSVNNWLNTEDNIQKHIKTTDVYDGEVSIDLTPTVDCSECYLLLFIDDLSIYFDMEIDNVTVTEKLVTE